MPPIAALLLCILFILYLYKLDNKNTTDVSKGLWIPQIWMIIISSRMVGLWFNLNTATSTAEALEQGSPIDRNVFSILIIAGLILLYKRKLNWSQIFHRNVMLFIYILYCSVSIMWSDFPYVSLKRWIKEVGNIIMVLIVLTEPNPFGAIKILFKRCAYALIPLSIVLIKYFPHLGRQYHRYSGELMLTGVTTAKNSLAVTCLVCGFILFVEILSKWTRNNVIIDKKVFLLQLITFIMTLWLLIKANSITSLICFIVVIFSFILLGLPSIKINIKYMEYYLLFVLLFFCIIQVSFDLKENILFALGRESTLTGRTELWQVLIDMSTKPLIGTGYNSFWLGDRLKILSDMYWWGPTEAHNGYLEVYINIGIIGLILFIGFMFTAYINIRRSLLIDFEYGRFRMVLLGTILLYNLTESTFRPDMLMYFIFILISVNIPIKAVNTKEIF
jgi:exopolysaccharide production protein ExoQ